VKRLVTLLAAALVSGGALALRAETDLPTDSLYQLRAHLVSQKGESVGFDLDRGHPTLISMFYGSCPAACPMLITSMQAYESHLDPASQSHLRVLLISFDPVHDTPQQLGHLARLHGADPTRWTFTNAPEADARKIAALLGFRYRRLADGSFDHSLLITLIDGQGRVLATTTTLVGDKAFQAKLQAATAARSF
jgi:protein SCO1/2